MSEKADDFIKKMLMYGVELHKSKSRFDDVVILNDAEILYKNHIKQLEK